MLQFLGVSRQRRNLLITQAIRSAQLLTALKAQMLEDQKHAVSANMQTNANEREIEGDVGVFGS